MVEDMRAEIDPMGNFAMTLLKNLRIERMGQIVHVDFAASARIGGGGCGESRRRTHQGIVGEIVATGASMGGAIGALAQADEDGGEREEEGSKREKGEKEDMKEEP